MDSAVVQELTEAWRGEGPWPSQRGDRQVLLGLTGTRHQGPQVMIKMWSPPQNTLKTAPPPTHTQMPKGKKCPNSPNTTSSSHSRPWGSLVPSDPWSIQTFKQPLKNTVTPSGRPQALLITHTRAIPQPGILRKGPNSRAKGASKRFQSW